jgi:hypothetical protein
VKTTQVMLLADFDDVLIDIDAFLREIPPSRELLTISLLSSLEWANHRRARIGQCALRQRPVHVCIERVRTRLPCHHG